MSIQSWWKFIRQHPRTVAFIWPALLIILAIGGYALLTRDGQPARSTVPTNGTTTNTAAANTNPSATNTNGSAPATNQSIVIDDGWIDRLGIVVGSIRIHVNALEFSPGEIVESAVVNGNASPVYYLDGCLIPSVQKHEAGNRVSYPTATVTCAALPECRTVEPDATVRLTDWNQLIFKKNADGSWAEAGVRESGIYQIPFTYGSGCTDGKLTGEITVVSEEITVR